DMDPVAIIPTHPFERTEIDKFRSNPFPDMIMFVVDVSQGRMALGGEMHADAEQALLETGSRQQNLWGGNLWPWENPMRVEYVSLINIRPSVDNRGVEIASGEIRKAVDRIVARWIRLSRWNPDIRQCVELYRVLLSWDRRTQTVEP
ncbi:MAG: DUF5674 family protein, partial [Bacteroidota bacterium]